MQDNNEIEKQQEIRDRWNELKLRVNRNEGEHERERGKEKGRE